VPVLHLGFVTFLFSCSPRRRPHRSIRPLAVQPQIVPVPCKLLNQSVPACYSLPCLSSSSHAPILPAAPCRLVLFALSVIQLLYFQQFPDSSAQWTHLNPFPFNRLRTLSIAMGGVPPSSHLYTTPLLQSALFPVVHPISLQPLTKCSSRNSFALRTIHFHGECMGVAVVPAKIRQRILELFQIGD
jgi:hypothetical protein